MGTLWTPDGERVVPPAQQSQAQQQSSPQEVRNPDVEAMIKAQAEAIGIDLDTLSPEDRAAAEEAVMEMVETRQRLASVPASEVIANHAMGLYELAAIHLYRPEPAFAEAALAIDALRAIVNQLGDRLGEAAPVLQEAMGQIQMAFVSIKTQFEKAGAAPEGPTA